MFTEKSCEIFIDRLEDFFPLLLDPLDHAKFLIPSKSGRISIKHGHSVYLACSGSNNQLSSLTKQQYLEVSCVDKIEFQTMDGIHTFDIHQLKCEKVPQSTIKHLQSTQARPIYRDLKIGFHTDSSTFLPIIEVKQRAEDDYTLYVKSVIWDSIRHRQLTRIMRPVFDNSYYHTETKIEAHYVIPNQRQVLAKLLGYDPTWFAKNGGFNRGHLAPMNSFVYTSCALATFYYINTAPQLGSINNGNWRKIEEYVSKMAKHTRFGLTVYTGVEGQLTLKDVHHVMRPISLQSCKGNANSNCKLKVPMHFWKIVYIEGTKKGVAFVTVNSPIQETPKRFLCHNLNPEIEEAMIPTYPHNAGFSYWCRVDDFLKTSGIQIDDPAVKEVDDLLLIWKDGRTYYEYEGNQAVDDEDQFVLQKIE